MRAAWVGGPAHAVLDQATGSGKREASLNYAHLLQTGRQANFWIEPAYVTQLKRRQTLKHKMSGTELEITSSLGRDRAGVRIGMALPVGKQGTLQAKAGRLWSVGNARRQDSTFHLGYSHRF